MIDDRFSAKSHSAIGAASSQVLPSPPASQSSGLERWQNAIGVPLAPRTARRRRRDRANHTADEQIDGRTNDIDDDDDKHNDRASVHNNGGLAHAMKFKNGLRKRANHNGKVSSSSSSSTSTQPPLSSESPIQQTRSRHEASGATRVIVGNQQGAERATQSDHNKSSEADKKIMCRVERDKYLDIDKFYTYSLARCYE